jgi:acetolactate synthase I/II/III large subunit
VSPTANTVAAELLDILAAEGVTDLYLNPGTDTAPILDSLAARRHAGFEAPRPVLCLHEHVALSAAIGQFMVTRQTGAVMVHVDVGTLNLGGAIHNVQRNNVGVVVFAGRTPHALTNAVPGHRDTPIHWLQDQPDQAVTMRAYGKWALDVPRARDLAPTIRRAFQVADSVPNGLAYVMLPRETLMEPAAGGNNERLARPRPPAPDRDALTRVAAGMAAAERPLIIAQRVGRHPPSAAVLADLAHWLGSPVIDIRNYVNISCDHELNAGGDQPSLVEDADAILVLDTEVPWVPSRVRPAAGAKVFQIDIDCLKSTMPTWAFPIDIAVTADTKIALAMLLDMVKWLLPGPCALWPAGARALTERRRSIIETANSGRASDTADATCAAINSALPQSCIVLEEAVTNRGAVLRQVPRAPGHYFQVGASSLGWAVGAALGVKRACPDQAVVVFTGDGAFHFSVPTAALWSAKRATAGFVVVILNNQRYAGSQAPVERLFPNGVAARTRDFLEADLSPPIDYVALARACGGNGETVTRAADGASAMERALASADSGTCYVLDVRLPVPG